MKDISNEAKINQEPLIDEMIIGRYKSRANLIQLLVDAFLKEAPVYFQDMRQAMNEENLEGLRGAAHGLKSCSMNLGASRLAAACQIAESAAGQGEIEGIIERVGPLLFETEEALKSVKRSVLMEVAV